MTDAAPDAAIPDVTFPPTRAAGLARLRAFAPRAGRAYGDGRGHDLPGHPHVSTLSPWIRHRAITEAEVAAAVLAEAPTAEKLLTELCWRTYFKGWLELRPAIWTGYRHDLDRALDGIATEAGLRRRWEEACEGRTGIAPFDHWAQELVRTGYLHNHARMWFASIWMHTLRLPWHLGADLFLRHLLDGDPASTVLSWRWVAGLHTRGKSYRADASNIARYTGGRFDVATIGPLAPEAPPLDGPPHPEPGPVPQDADWDGSLRTGLVVHDDDLHPDFLLRRGLDPAARAVLTAVDGRSPLMVSGAVRGFTDALARDALGRLGGGTPTGEVAGILRWADAEGLQQIVTPHAPTGPVRTRLDALATALPIPLIRPLRAWDSAAWPYATKGFFSFRDRIPAILGTIDATGPTG